MIQKINARLLIAISIFTIFASSAFASEISASFGFGALSPPFANGTISGTASLLPGRVSGLNNSCDNTTSGVSGTVSGTFRYHSFVFTPAQSGCVTMTITNASPSLDLIAAVYPSFNSDTPEQNVEAITRNSMIGYGKKDFFSFKVTQGVPYTLVVFSATNNATTQQPYRVDINESIAVSSDFDGDGFSDAAVYRPSTGPWFILRSSDSTVGNDFFGLAEDIPLDADFDGDGRTDIAVFRPSNAGWYIKYSHSGKVTGEIFGSGTDKPSPGDYDHDGISDIAVFRPSTGQWFVSGSKNGFTDFFGFNFGSNGDIPIGSERK